MLFLLPKILVALELLLRKKEKNIIETMSIIEPGDIEDGACCRGVCFEGDHDDLRKTYTRSDE
jgi:hypothetical protein